VRGQQITVSADRVKPAYILEESRHGSMNQSPIEEISDLLDNLPVNACVELTRRLLTAVPTLPSGATRSRAVLKIVILFVAKYGSTP
jgi:hypothetical protein